MQFCMLNIRCQSVECDWETEVLHAVQSLTLAYYCQAVVPQQFTRLQVTGRNMNLNVPVLKTKYQFEQ